MTARDRVAAFVRAWRLVFPTDVEIDVRIEGERLLLADLEALSHRQVVRTLPQLQALAIGTKLAITGDRAAQVEIAEAWHEGTGEELEAKRLIYVGTDLYDNLLPDPTREERDTLRRCLPAVVIDAPGV